MLTVKQVAEQLKVSANTVINKLIKTGLLKSTKVGKQYRIRLEDLHTYLKVSPTQLNKDLAGKEIKI